jgi:hypothetical protein
MEEQTKEVVETKETCCGHKGMFMKHHHCCGHKVVRAFVLALIIFMVFSIGVSVGRHLSSGFGRDFENGNFEQRGGGRMMRGYDNNNYQNYQTENIGGCAMQNGGRINDAVISGQATCPMQQAQIQTQVVSPTPIKTAIPVK